jgi:hypothetical protein
MTSRHSNPSSNEKGDEKTIPHRWTVAGSLCGARWALALARSVPPPPVALPLGHVKYPCCCFWVTPPGGCASLGGACVRAWWGGVPALPCTRCPAPTLLSPLAGPRLGACVRKHCPQTLACCSWDRFPAWWCTWVWSLWRTPVPYSPPIADEWARVTRVQTAVFLVSLCVDATTFPLCL